MNERAMNNLTSPLLAAIDAVRAALAEADISAMNLRIEATGRVDGDLNVQFKLRKDYDDDTKGSNLAAVVNEYLHRHNWNHRHAPLCLPNCASESEPTPAIESDEIPY